MVNGHQTIIRKFRLLVTFNLNTHTMYVFFDLLTSMLVDQKHNMLTNMLKNLSAT